MATWANVAIWIIWALWTFVEVVGLIQIIQHNSNSLRVALAGKMFYGPIAKATSFLYVILTIFWFCYNFV